MAKREPDPMFEMDIFRGRYHSDIGEAPLPRTMFLSEINGAEHLSHLKKDFDLSDATVIGKGGNGSVSVVTRKSNGEKYALKTIYNRHMQDPRMREDLLHEIEVQKALDHPNIVKVYEAFEDPKHSKMYIVMELCTGGDLCSRLRSPGSKHGFGERGIATLMEEMLSAVLYCHQRGVVHRDIKLDNFMFEDPSADSQLKLIDFGFACEVTPGHEKMWDKLGTPSYMAPELWKTASGRIDGGMSGEEEAGEYSSAVDMWALGVTCYMLLSGVRPFYHTDVAKRARMICEDPLEFPEGWWGGVSAEAKDFVSRLLTKDPNQRINCQEAMGHPWIVHKSKLHMRDGAEDLKRHDEVVRCLQDFSQKSELHKVALEVIAYSTPPAKMKMLRDMFVHMDADNSGTLTRDEFRHAMSQHPEIPMAQVDLMFAAMDQSHTGDISYTEFLAAAISSQQAMDAPSVTTVFGLLDKDGDGFVTACDLMDALGIDEHDEFQMKEVEEILRLGAAIDHHEGDKPGHRRHHGHRDGGDATSETKLSIADFKYLLMASHERSSAGEEEQASWHPKFLRLDKFVGKITSHIEHIGHHVHASALGKKEQRATV